MLGLYQNNPSKGGLFGCLLKHTKTSTATHTARWQRPIVSYCCTRQSSITAHTADSLQCTICKMATKPLMSKTLHLSGATSKTKWIRFRSSNRAVLWKCQCLQERAYSAYKKELTSEKKLFHSAWIVSCKSYHSVLLKTNHHGASAISKALS